MIKKITVEFNQLEFVPLSELNIKLLKFDIMTHDKIIRKFIAQH